MCRISEELPHVGEVQLKAPLVRLPRRCLAFRLLVEYKLSQHQLRSCRHLRMILVRIVTHLQIRSMSLFVFIIVREGVD